MTLELNIESKASASSPVETEANINQDISEKQRAFARNVFAAFEKSMSDNERLSALYQVDRDEFEDEVDDAVDDYLQDDEDFQEFFAKFREARKSGGGDSFVPEIKERRSKARELIIASLNLPEESNIIGVDEATKNIENLLKDVPREPEGAELALNTLGIKIPVEDEPGEFDYKFPYGLLPEKVNDKWREYLQAVIIHIDTAKNATKDNRDDVVDADRTRTYAHNAITKNIHDILQLNQFGMEMADTRRLLARVRNDELMTSSESYDTVSSKTQEQLKIARKLARHRTGH